MKSLWEKDSILGPYSWFLLKIVWFGYAYGPLWTKRVFKLSWVFVYDCVFGKLVGGFLNFIYRNLKIIECSYSFNWVLNRFFKALYKKTRGLFCPKIVQFSYTSNIQFVNCVMLTANLWHFKNRQSIADGLKKLRHF